MEKKVENADLVKLNLTCHAGQTTSRDC